MPPTEGNPPPRYLRGQSPRPTDRTNVDRTSRNLAEEPTSWPRKRTKFESLDNVHFHHRQLRRQPVLDDKLSKSKQPAEPPITAEAMDTNDDRPASTNKTTAPPNDPAVPQAPTQTPRPKPSNWESMTKTQRRNWQKRGGRF